MKEAIVLAGGLGTRLRNVVHNVPKPLAPVNERPFLAYLLDYLAKQGFEHVVLSTGYMHEKISACFGKSHHGIHLSYAVENEPLGTGGGILNAMQYCNNDEMAVLNGDTLFRVNYNELERCFRSHRTDLAVVLRHVDDTSRYGSVALSPDGRIGTFAEKAISSGPGLINGGIYMLRRTLLDACGFNEIKKFSFEKDLLEPFSTHLPFFGLISNAYFIDIGVPEDYCRAQAEFPSLA
ncbi:MAG: nucleotidyltransferase family protein [Bacteroidales bacterium]|nr:nucleotidyltransferase family protein [Bacteroidales bacterium]